MYPLSSFETRPRCLFVQVSSSLPLGAVKAGRFYRGRKR